MNYSNLVIWNAQIALLAAGAAALAALFRLRPAPARLLYWQVLLAVCLALPALQPWQRRTFFVPAAETAPAAASVVFSPAPVAPRPRPLPLGWPEAAAALLAAGMLGRAAWFALGLARLSRYRRAARPLHPLPPPVLQACRRVGVYPEISLSDEVSGPVTFGFRDPVILLPARFPELDPEVQSAVACHELLHVRRRDWLFTAMEELLRAVFWFHPAVWWMLGQIQLAREQSVDRQVVKLSQAREQYVDALLALSGARRQLDLAPAPLFLRRRHLTARVAAILKEADMSYKRLILSMAACAGAVALSGWLVCGLLPLQAAPQVVADAAGVKVTGADRILHRDPIYYPAEARAKGIEGNVILDVVLAPDGTVADAAVISGPEELRKAALASVLAWHFDRSAAARQQVHINYSLARAAARNAGAVGGGIIGSVPAGRQPELRAPVVLYKLSIQSVAQSAAAELRQRLQLEEGKTVVDDAMLQRLRLVVRGFDAGLTLNPAWMTVKGGTGYGESAGPSPAPPGAGLALIIYPTGALSPGHAASPGEARPGMAENTPKKLSRVEVRGLAPEAEAELRRRLALQDGQAWDKAVYERMSGTVKEFDPHLRINQLMTGRKARGPGGEPLPPEVLEVAVVISAPGSDMNAAQVSAPAAFPAPPPGVRRIRVGGNVQQQKQVHTVQPTYPPLAKQAKVSGVVRFDVLIDTEGNVKAVAVTEGHPLLVPAAMAAVREYRYAPTLLGGKPAEVQTTVITNFSISE